ncbi:MAG: tetratricopeptide repeat protein [Rhodoferax sp.]|nr:tetratricopeptide repeat protein [Rhodoferax sp.]
MSLLLDALNRASQDKAAAAAVSQAVSPTYAPVTLEQPPAPAQSLPGPVVLTTESAPATVWPTFEIELSASESTSESQAALSELSTQRAIDTPLVSTTLEPDVRSEVHPVPPAINVEALSLTPEPTDENAVAPFEPVIQVEADRQGVATTTAKPPVLTSHTTDALDSARVAQKIVRAKAPPAHPMNRRVWVLGGLALALATGMASVVLGVWGDPLLLAQNIGIGGSASSVNGIAAVPSVAASAPLSGAAEAVVAAAAADQATLPVQADLAKTQSGNAAPRRTGPSRRPAIDTVVVAKVATCPPGTRLPDCQPSAASTSTSSTPRAAVEPLARQASVFSRSSGPSVLEQGYGALTGGRLQEASQAYAQALASNPEERDALLGLAYIAQLQGRKNEALLYYQRVLRQEPGNATAQSALLILYPLADPQDFGSSSRSLAEQNPDSAAAQSLLGHALARQDRLAEAQLAFERAQQLEPTVARHAFNLAVALDRLHQYDAAQRYYERAAALVLPTDAANASGFSLAEVKTRLTQLHSAADAK